MSYGKLLSYNTNEQKELWFNEKSELIKNLDFNLIKDADNIYDFINCCLVYKEYLISNKLNILLRFDATCSGIQHISALLEDIVLGEQVNIIESDDSKQPNDIYSQQIPKIKNAIIEEFKNTDTDTDTMNKLINFPITRKLVKKPIQTIPYTITINGINKHLISQSNIIINPNNKKKEYEFIIDDNSKIILEYFEIIKLSKIIYKSILTEYPILDKFFKYYRTQVSILVRLDLPIKWENPSGVIIIQDYFKVYEESLSLSDKYTKKKIRVTLLTKFEPKKADMLKHRNAIIPNLIHSLDSNHLILIVNKFINDNQNILTVHDCFIIHPQNYYLLQNIVRSEFINLYANKSLIEKFHENALSEIKEHHNIQKTKDGYLIDKLGILIPNHPYQNNPKFFKNVIDSNYLIK